MTGSSVLQLTVEVVTLEAGGVEAYSFRFPSLLVRAESRDGALKELHNSLTQFLNQDHAAEEQVEIVLTELPSKDQAPRADYDFWIEQAWVEAIDGQLPAAWVEISRCPKDGQITKKVLGPLQIVNAIPPAPAAVEGSVFVVALQDATCAPGSGEPALRGYLSAVMLLPPPLESPADPTEIEKQNMASLLLEAEENIEMADSVWQSFHSSASRFDEGMDRAQYANLVARAENNSPITGAATESPAHDMRAREAPPVVWAANRLREAAWQFKFWLESSEQSQHPSVATGIWLGMKMQKAACTFLASPDNDGMAVNSRGAKMARRTQISKSTASHTERLRSGISAVFLTGKILDNDQVIDQLLRAGILGNPPKLYQKGKFTVLQDNGTPFPKTENKPLTRESINNEIRKLRPDKKGRGRPKKSPAKPR